MDRIWTTGRKPTSIRRRVGDVERAENRPLGQRFFLSRDVRLSPVRVTRGPRGTSGSFKLVRSLAHFHRWNNLSVFHSLPISYPFVSLRFYGFYCGSDESTGKPCNDKGQGLLGDRENTSDQWGSQAASGHDASFSVAEKRARETAGTGYHSPVIKTTHTDHSAH